MQIGDNYSKLTRIKVKMKGREKTKRENQRRKEGSHEKCKKPSAERKNHLEKDGPAVRKGERGIHAGYGEVCNGRGKRR